LESEADLRRAAEALLKQTQYVAISLGGDGLWLTSRAEGFPVSVNTRPPAVSIQNPTGAGDALLAGLLWALQRGWNLEDASRWGVATGTCAAMKPGVEFGFCKEVEEVYARTFARRIKP